MIIYGWRTKPLGSEPLAHVCSACGGDSLKLHVFHRYAHVYWIPLIPLGKIAVLECPSCGKVFEKKTWTPEDRSAAQGPLRKFRVPLTDFAGLAAILALVAFGIVHDRQEMSHTQSLHHAPAKGDYVVLRAPANDDHPYRIVRVHTVAGEKIEVSAAQFAYKSVDGARKHLDSGKLQDADFAGRPKELSRSQYDGLDVRYIERRPASGP
jgi:hypothetical protein